MIYRATKDALGTLQGLRCVALVVLLMSGGLLTSSAVAEERTRPIKIGALTESWGPTPAVVGLRDGLLELGYRENEQFVLGVRFTQGDLTALPTAARELVQYGVDIIFTSEDSPAKAAQMATTRIPIVFSVCIRPRRSGSDPELCPARRQHHRSNRSVPRAEPETFRTLSRDRPESEAGPVSLRCS